MACTFRWMVNWLAFSLCFLYATWGGFKSPGKMPGWDVWFRHKDIGPTSRGWVGGVLLGGGGRLGRSEVPCFRQDLGLFNSALGLPATDGDSL